MTTTNFRVVNFGKSKSGLTSISYSIFDINGNLITKTSNGIFEISQSSGIYGANIPFSSSFSGSILWQSGESEPVFAVEEYNHLAVNPKTEEIFDILIMVSSSIDEIYKVQSGRWKVNTSTNQLELYGPDNVSLIYSFNLFDANGNPVSSSPTERKRVM